MNLPLVRSRLRAALWLAFACWAIFSTAWIARRWMAVHILEKARQQYNGGSLWHQPTWCPSIWGQLLPTTRIQRFEVSGPLENGGKIGWALRVCGPLNELLLLDSGGTAQTQALFDALGPQNSVKFLALREVPLSDDSVSAALEQFPNVEEIVCEQMPYTGQNLPSLPLLKSVTMVDTPFSDEGLAHALRCPHLHEIHLVNTNVTPAGMRQLPPARPSAPMSISFANRTVTQDELEPLADLLLKAWPKSRFAIYGESGGRIGLEIIAEGDERWQANTP